MSSRNRVPPLLEPYIRLPPEASLLLLTGVLNATPNWLVTRYLSSLLLNDGKKRAGLNTAEDLQDAESEGKTAVVLVSWMRDWDFWKLEGRRGGALDLPRLAQQNRFAFVDGLTGLFEQGGSQGGGKVASIQTSPNAANPQGRPIPSVTSAPSRGPVSLPNRGLPVQRAMPQAATQQTASPAQPIQYRLQSPSLIEAQKTISTAISTLAPRNEHVFLILDSPTLLLATTPITSTELAHFILRLRSEVHSTLLSVEADAPLLAASHPGAFDLSLGLDSGSQATPLEAEHAAFVVGQAHGARLVIGTRPLDTGVARDVSGVLSVGRGAAWGEDENENEEDEATPKESAGRQAEVDRGMEVLYYVQADGNVKVFERGAGDVG